MIQSPRSNIRNASQRGSSASDAPPQNDNSEQAIAHRIFQSGNHAEIQAALSGSMGPAIQAAAAFLSSRQPSSPRSAPPQSSSPRLSWASPQPSSPHPNGPATAPSVAPTPSDLPASASPSASSAPDAASPSPSSAAPPQSAATPNPATPSAAPSPADPSAAPPAASSSPAPNTASPAPAQAADPLTSSAPPASAPVQDPTAAPLAADPSSAAPDVSPPLVYQPISSDIASRFEKCTSENVSSVCIAENPDLETQGKRGVAIDGECIEVAPGLLGDLNLCAHELTHIVQQRGPSQKSSPHAQQTHSDPESEAVAAASAVASGQPFSISLSSSQKQLFEESQSDGCTPPTSPRDVCPSDAQLNGVSRTELSIQNNESIINACLKKDTALKENKLKIENNIKNIDNEINEISQHLHQSHTDGTQSSDIQIKIDQLNQQKLQFQNELKHNSQEIEKTEKNVRSNEISNFTMNSCVDNPDSNNQSCNFLEHPALVKDSCKSLSSIGPDDGKGKPVPYGDSFEDQVMARGDYAEVKGKFVSDMIDFGKGCVLGNFNEKKSDAAIAGEIMCSRSPLAQARDCAATAWHSIEGTVHPLEFFNCVPGLGGKKAPNNVDSMASGGSTRGMKGLANSSATNWAKTALTEAQVYERARSIRSAYVGKLESCQEISENIIKTKGFEGSTLVYITAKGEKLSTSPWLYQEWSNHVAILLPNKKTILDASQLNTLGNFIEVRHYESVDKWLDDILITRNIKLNYGTASKIAPERVEFSDEDMKAIQRGELQIEDAKPIGTKTQQNTEIQQNNNIPNGTEKEDPWDDTDWLNSIKNE